jgi:hypothetical protein
MRSALPRPNLNSSCASGESVPGAHARPAHRRPFTLIQLRIIVRFRLVNYSGAPWQFSSYIPIASATVIYVGCGRAIYTPDFNKTAVGYQRRDAVTPAGFGNRVEVFVCNYGPVDRLAPRQLYELGRPGVCPPGTLHSGRYQLLCSKYVRNFVHGSFYRELFQIDALFSPSYILYSLFSIVLCRIRASGGSENSHFLAFSNNRVNSMRARSLLRHVIARQLQCVRGKRTRHFAV